MCNVYIERVNRRIPLFTHININESTYSTQRSHVKFHYESNNQNNGSNAHTHACTHAQAHTHAAIIYMCVGITSEKSKCTRDPNPFLWLLIKLRICQWIGIHTTASVYHDAYRVVLSIHRKIISNKANKSECHKQKKNKIQIHILVHSHTSHTLIIMVLAIRPLV